MRITGGYSLHQSLTIETASIVKQAVSLARRRGHAQVTPLHVAIAMFSCPSTSLLKRACLQSHSHPLQFKALDLCFNVALNRLPTSVGPHSPSPLPSLSNALVAAFKRAQAHQRRGSVESQSSVVALKVELHQLVVSVLDDPSVSRVMREAGFSSTQVKHNVEQSANKNVPLVVSSRRNSHTDNDEVFEAMASHNAKNIIVLGERGESVVRGVIEKFEKNEVPESMKFAHFVSMPLRGMTTREEFESKLSEARAYAKGRGVVMYLGDVGWISDFWSKHDYRCYYERVEYVMVKEISRLIVENSAVWMIGIASSSQTYAKCKIGSPSLETLWSLHPLTIPVANLALTLGLENREAVEDQKLGCCSYNFKREATSTSNSKLPSWLQLYKDENTERIRRREYFDDRMEHLCKKWNSSTTPCSSASVSSNGLHKPDLVSNPNSSPNSASSSEDNHYTENRDSVIKLNTLRETLEKKVPSHGHLIPEIASTIIKCRSRIVRQDSWMFFLGAEEGVDDKVTVARELAKAVFGSYDSFTAIGISCFSPPRVHHGDSTEGEVVSDDRKRARDEHGASIYERFAEAVGCNPSRVFYVKGVEGVDCRSLKGFERAIRDASVSVCGGGAALMRDAIVIFSCEEFKCEELMSEEEKCGLLDLNIATRDDDDDDDDDDEKSTSKGGGILDLVDHKVVFKMQV